MNVLVKINILFDTLFLFRNILVIISLCYTLNDVAQVSLHACNRSDIDYIYNYIHGVATRTRTHAHTHTQPVVDSIRPI